MGLTEEQITDGLISESMLISNGHHYSSRRERIAAHLMAAIVVSRGCSALDGGISDQAEDIVEAALKLADALIIRLGEERFK